MWYSNKGAYPVDTLPHRIILSDGSSRTDSSTFTNAELVKCWELQQQPLHQLMILIPIN